MKKLFIISLALLLTVGVACNSFAVDYGSVVDSDQGAQVTRGYKAGHNAGELIQQGGLDSEPHRKFRKVRYVPPQPSSTMGSGDHLLDLIVSRDSVVIWETGISGDDAVTVTISVTSQDTRIAGILATDALPPVSTDTVSAAQADIGKRNWAFLQTYGLGNAFYKAGSGTSAAGDAFGVSTITGEIGLYSVSPDAAGSDTATSTQLGQGGFFMDASVAGQDGVQVFIRCE